MAADDGGASSCFLLLQPEMLSKESLIEILLSRCVSRESMHGMTKEMLVDLFRRVALPLPQRECYSARRDAKSKDVSKSKTKKTLISPPLDTKGSGFMIGFNGSLKDKISVKGPETPNTGTPNNRLKPPPEIQNGNKKIRLSNSKCDSLDNIVINNRRKSQDTEQVTVSNEKHSSDTVDEKNDEKVTNVEEVKQIGVEPKRVSLKRNFNQQVAVNLNQEQPESRPDDSPQEKKARAKITWP